MGINFPASPLVGDIYPTPAVPGLPQYVWDGTIWKAGTAASSAFVKIAGDVMTGALTLPGNAASALQAVPKQQLDARVNDVLAYSGMQVNGAMEVSQEYAVNTSVSLSSAAWKYILDGWTSIAIGSGTMSGQQNNTVLPAGFTRNVYVSCGTPYTTMAASDLLAVAQNIEGYRVNRMGWGTPNAQPITIGFWVLTSVPGTLTVAVKNSNNGNSRSYCVPVAVAAGNTWEYKTLTVPGCTDGTWDKGNTGGITIAFTGGSGTTFGGATPSTWLTTDKYAATGTTNFFTTSSNGILITGVVVLPGIYAPTAAQSPLIMRSADQELLTCQRYYEKGFNALAITNANPGNIGSDISYRAVKRATPTVSIANVGSGNVSTPTIGTSTAYGCQIVTPALVAGAVWYSFDYTADARL